MQIAMGIPVSVVSIVNAIAILSIIAISQVRVLYFKPKRRGNAANERYSKQCFSGGFLLTVIRMSVPVLLAALGDVFRTLWRSEHRH